MKKFVAFDVESTGLDPFNDRIIEVSFVELSTEKEIFHQVFDPGVPIPEASSEIHGIQDEDVEECPPFASYASDIQELVDKFCLLGYGNIEFDNLFLDVELRRAGKEGVDLTSSCDIDLLSVWRELEPRTLAGAVRRFLGREHTGQHTASGDAKVLTELLEAIRAEWDLTIEELIESTSRKEVIDRADRLRWDGEVEEVVFTFGQHAGEAVKDHPDYLDWMLQEDFPISTKRAIRVLQENNFRPVWEM